MAVDPRTIISTATDLVSIPTSGLDPTIPAGFAAGNGFSAPVVTVPSDPSVTPDPVDQNLVSEGSGGKPVTLPGAPVQAVYDAVTATLAISLPTVPQPVYNYGSGPDTLPTPKAEHPPLDYPQAPFETVETSAGLEGVDVPQIEAGERPTLDAIDQTPFTPTTLAPYTSTIPTADIPADYRLPQPDRLAYDALAGFMAVVRRVGDDGGLDLLHQDGLYDGALGDAWRAAIREARAARDEGADRGFPLASGPVTAKMADALYKAYVAGDEANFKTADMVHAKVANAQTTAMDSGITLEKKNFELLTTYAAQLLQVQRFNVRMATAVFDATVAVFNHAVDGINALILAYQDYASAVRKQNQAVSSQADRAQAQADTNQADADAYDAQMGTIQTAYRANTLRAKAAAHPIREFQEYITGLLANVAIARTNIDAFRDATTAFSRSTESDIAALNAYVTGVDAWATGVDSVEANTRLLDEFYRTVNEKQATYGSYLTDYNRSLGDSIRLYNTYAQAQRTFLQAESDKLEAYARVLTDHNAGIEAVTRYLTAWNTANASSVAAANQYGLVTADQSTRESALDAERAAIQARLDAGRLAAQATTAAGIAQAAYGVTSGSLRISGSIDAQHGSRDNSTQSWTEQGSRSWSNSTTLRGSTS